MNQEQIAQMVLENMGAIRQGVGRVTQSLGLDVHADLVSDAILAILEKRGASFDPSKGSAAVFCRMVSYQIALDRFRAMKRGGQFSGAYSGIGNRELDSPGKLDSNGETNKKELASPIDESAWVNDARAMVAEILPQLTSSEQELWELMSDSFDTDSYALSEGITQNTVWVRMNRLRSKVRGLLAAA
jgi:DNA-directed RNA polymerase specialized sigma24 family protein